MKFEHFSFGKIQIDGAEYCHDIVIDRGEIRERKKKPSKKFRVKDEAAYFGARRTQAASSEPLQRAHGAM